MIRDYHAVRPIAKAISEEADAVIDAYKKSRIVDEPSITDRLMGAIEARVNRMRFSAVPASGWGGGMWSPIVWHAKTLRSGHHSAAEEKEYGADIMGVFSVDTAKYKIAKGFLAQAKRAEPKSNFTSAEWLRLTEQCRRMLSVTPDSFVIAYSKSEGVRFFSAQAVVALNGLDLFDLYSLGPLNFFEKHFQSFIGDHRLNQPDIQVLDRLRGESRSRAPAFVLEIEATYEG